MGRPNNIDRARWLARSWRVMVRSSAALCALGAALALSGGGCGTTTTPPVDEGNLVRAASCDAPEVVTLVDGMTVQRSFDLRTAPHGVTTGCAGTDGTGQVVYELVVPGSGPHAIVATTGVVGTDRSLDTVLALRRTVCAGPVSDACFDDYVQDRRARADFLASGGDHVFLIMTAYASADEGPVTLAITSRPNTPPTIDSASALLAGSELLVDVSGGDADGNGWGVLVRLHGPAGELIDLNGDGLRSAADVLQVAFARSVSGAMTFAERARIPLTTTQVPRVGGAASAYVRILDEPLSVSDVDVRTPLLGGTLVLSGATCDATHVCSEELTCAPGTPHTCQPTPARASACGAATALSIPTPTTMTTSTSAMGVLMQGTGLFQGECAPTLGLEDIYTVTVPDMIDVDLVLTTESPGSDSAGDTVIYVRTQCVEPATSMTTWCNDDDTDATPSTYLSRLVIEDAAPGDYAVFVEAWQGVQPDTSLRYELSASLRPVLPTGATCDPTEARDRCTGDACDPTTRRCP